MRTKTKNMLIGILIFYFLFLFDISIPVSLKNSKLQIQYTGLLWVRLDHYNIAKYPSEDKEKRWIDLKISYRV